MTSNPIHSEYDDTLPGYVVSMPDFITLQSLKEWKHNFNIVLRNMPDDGPNRLLIDTGNHNFESVECLKFLREYLTETPEFRSRFHKAAFVAPSSFVSPHIVSNMEAYFTDFQKAFEWLKLT